MVCNFHGIISQQIVLVNIIGLNLFQHLLKHIAYIFVLGFVQEVTGFIRRLKHWQFADTTRKMSSKKAFSKNHKISSWITGKLLECIWDLRIKENKRCT